jgi:hypothetical protein
MRAGSNGIAVIKQHRKLSCADVFGIGHRRIYRYRNIVAFGK